jgi:hypothetical protein
MQGEFMGKYADDGYQKLSFLNEAFVTSPTYDVFRQRLAEHDLEIVDTGSTE